MKKILKAYLKRLTNLSSRNKSLVLTRLAAEQFLDITQTDFLEGKPCFDLVVQLIQRKAKIVLCDRQDPRYDKVNELSRTLQKIARTEHFIEEERGSRDLFVGYPFIKGKLSDGSLIHAPLLFFPVTLRLEKEQWCLFRRDDSEIGLNRSFALAYSHFNQVPVSDEVLEKTFEDLSQDALEFRTQLYEWLKESPFKINFNQQLFEDKLTPYDQSKASDLQSTERNGELKLFPEAILGIFPQAGSYLVPDYEKLLSESETADLDFPLLLEEENSEEKTPTVNAFYPIKEEQLLTPFQSDVSQEEVIRAVKSGASVVVQGPPGTGKSQVISNLMADFAARGKRVLLVCQKRAALDVVFQRLESLGLNPFAALIHDFKNDRADLYKKLADQIDKVEEYQKQNYSLDSVVIDREFTQESRQIDRLVDELEGFRKALFDESSCGLSIKELYLTSNPSADFIDVSDLYRQLPLDSMESSRRNVQQYISYRQQLGKEHSWSERNSFAGYAMNDLRQMTSLLKSFPDFFVKQQNAFGDWAGVSFSSTFLQKREELAERCDDVSELINSAGVFELFQHYLQKPELATERLALTRQISEAIEGWEGIEHSLPANELQAFRAQLMRALEAKESGVKGKFWDWFSKERKAIEKAAISNGLGTELKDLSVLESYLKNRLELESWLQNLLFRDMNYLVSEKEEFSRRYLDYFEKCEKAADAVVRLNYKPWRDILNRIGKEAGTKDELVNKLAQAKQWTNSWDEWLDSASVYLSTEQIGRLIEDPATMADRLSKDLQRDFDSMVEMDTLWSTLSRLDQALLERIIEKDENIDRTTAIALLDNGIRLAWIEHIETQYPVLRSVSSLKMQQWEEQLQNSISRKQDLSRDIALLKLREKVYSNVESNRLGNRVTYRELHHQVTKKRKVWPIRKMIENFSDEVFSLTPCWLASPESVSAMFPMIQGLFDLVIFDEASQCYAEYGLPAAFRAKQVVVTGDSKQLQPSDLYRVRYEEDTDDELPEVALEVGSLLDLAAQSLAQYQLNGHYRSRSLDLIDFSNQFFYQGKLSLLPDFNYANDADPAIKYIKVEGIWQQNRNQLEAERVAELVSELADSGLSIGIVTFNFHQQQLIQEVLESNKSIPDGLFVKNIENVQGDERDVIIFSVGYAADAKGKLAMQFGSLNMQGGENRLNVAVTRARERIYVITSLWPAQLQTEQTANEGPKVLKAYLNYALDVSEGKFRPKLVGSKNYRSAWFLKDRMEKESDRFTRELPFADLTVRNEEMYEGLVLTDDDLYYESVSAKEPHAYLPRNLSDKNWPFYRVYSREYWIKREQLH